MDEIVKIFKSSNSVDISMYALIFNLIVGYLLSQLIAIHFKKFGSTLSSRAEFSQVLPFILMTTLLIITIVKSSLALSLGLVGALSNVRFRTPIRTPYELVHYFSLLTIGISAKVDLSITLILISLLSILPYFIKRFSLINKNTLDDNGKLSLNFQGLMKENDFKKIISVKNIRNYSVKNEGDNFNISGYALFNEVRDKDKFLNEWSPKINSYNVDLDENN